MLLLECQASYHILYMLPFGHGNTNLDLSTVECTYVWVYIWEGFLRFTPERLLMMMMMWGIYRGPGFGEGWCWHDCIE